MDSQQIRLLIYHCFLMGKNTVQAQVWLDKRYPCSASSKVTVKRQFADFKRGRTSTDDADRFGGPIVVITPGNIRNVNKIILANHKPKLNVIADSLMISKEHIHCILHEHLFTGKLSSKWFSMIQRAVWSSLAAIRRVFFMRCVTMDETWPSLPSRVQTTVS